MRQNTLLSLLTALAALLLAAPGSAQVTPGVVYSGKLQIGFSDQDNTSPTGQRSNNAIPICAGYAPSNPVSTKPAGTTLGTLIVNGSAGAPSVGVGAPLTFGAIGGSHGLSGGAQEFTNNTCNVAIPGFANPRLRSRTQVGAAHWPGRKGKFLPGSVYTNSAGTAMVGFADGAVPATPTATYMVSAGGGNTSMTPSGSPATVPYNFNVTEVRTFNNTNMTTGGGTSMTTSMTSTVQNLAGSGQVATIPFFNAGGGFQIVNPGGASFGGGVPFSGGGGVQLGVNFTVVGPTGMTLVPGDYGQVLYAEGFLPTDPQVFGTDAKGISILNPAAGYIPPTFTPTLNLVIGRQDLSYAARTPGGSTKDMQGQIRTVGGGINTPSGMVGTFMLPVGPSTFLTADCASGVPFPCPAIISPVAFTGQFGEYTTGTIQHVDQVGDFVTIRTAMGADNAVVPSAGNGNATRNLQLVAPWSASIKTVGAFGLTALLPALGFGGVSILDLNIIPVPEPGTLAMLGFGVLGLAGLGATRRSNR
jgi:hypothetical protein